MFFFVMILRPPRSTRTDTSFHTRRSSDLDRTYPFPCTASEKARKRRVEKSFCSGLYSGCHWTPRARRLAPVTETASGVPSRSEEHTAELQSLMRTSYADFCLKQKTNTTSNQQ